jgi:hypothetical protein
MNMIYEQSKPNQVKKNSRFNSIGHTGQLIGTPNVYNPNTFGSGLGGLGGSIGGGVGGKKLENCKKGVRTERNKTVISFKDMLQGKGKGNSVSSTRLSGVFVGGKSLKQSVSPNGS